MALERQTVKELHEVRIDHLGRYLRAAGYLEPNWSVLDLACGCGYGSFILAKYARQVTAVDRSQEAIDWAKTYFHKSNIRWFQSDWNDFEYGETFDAAVCLETVEHVKDDRGLLKKLHGCLKPGGILILSTPNEQLMPYNKEEASFHVRHYTPDEIQSILHECGFYVEEVLFQDDENSLEFFPYDGRFILIKAVKMAQIMEMKEAEETNEAKQTILFAANWEWNADWQKRAGAVFSQNGIEPHFLTDEVEVWADLYRDYGDHVHYIDPQYKIPGGHVPAEVMETAMACLTEAGNEDNDAFKQKTVYYYRKIQSLVRTLGPSAVVLWNGYGYLLTDIIRQISETENINRVFLELGFFRKHPSSLIVDADGVNFNSRKLKLFSVDSPIMDAAVDNMIADWKTQALEGPPLATSLPASYVFFPLQVHDDTQIYFHSPHFNTVVQALARTAEAMPDDVPLVVKPHPVDIARYGLDIYRACLRPNDIIVPVEENIYRLIHKARGIITINSTAGFEALAFHKPVLVLGNAFYADKGLTVDYKGENLAECIRDMLVFTPPTEKINRLIHYILKEYLFVYHGDVVKGEISETDISRLAARIACEAGLSLSLGAGDDPVKAGSLETDGILEKYRFASELEQKGNLNEALDLFAHILETTVEPSIRRQIYGGACFHRGDILLKKGEKTQAAEMFKKTLRYIPDHQLAKEKYLNNKFEIRISKSETNPKFQ